jgi:hypothetical protein
VSAQAGVAGDGLRPIHWFCREFDRIGDEIVPEDVTGGAFRIKVSGTISATGHQGAMTLTGHGPAGDGETAK